MAPDLHQGQDPVVSECGFYNLNRFIRVRDPDKYLQKIKFAGPSGLLPIPAAFRAVSRCIEISWRSSVASPYPYPLPERLKGRVIFSMAGNWQLLKGFQSTSLWKTGARRCPLVVRSLYMIRHFKCGRTRWKPLNRFTIWTGKADLGVDRLSWTLFSASLPKRDTFFVVQIWPFFDTFFLWASQLDL